MGESGINGITRQTTSILTVKLSDIKTNLEKLPSLEAWDISLDEGTAGVKNLRYAAALLHDTDIPVAFPTETVYGLGADATRSPAVLGIYQAKRRPADNPLIVHFHSLNQLRDILQPTKRSPDEAEHDAVTNGLDHNDEDDPIPPIYKPLIQRFWPGPLTLIMPNPTGSKLAPEVTSGLSTFGARMPSSPIALALLKLSNLPLAAPSANASTKPSPTAAEHVKHDLDGRITTILDGGPCAVGLESTVVDGLSTPPVVLRPGGVSIESLRECPGWERVAIGYKDKSQEGDRPRAPGMKYRHYSPEARVFLFPPGVPQPNVKEIFTYIGVQRKIGIIRTASWTKIGSQTDPHSIGITETFESSQVLALELKSGEGEDSIAVFDIYLSGEPELVGRSLFSALRELDLLHTDAILVEGIDENLGDVAAAVMNRLRKAADVNVRN